MDRYSISYWLDLLARRRRIALQVGLLAFGVIAIGTLLWPPTYESTAKILVQGQREQYLVSPALQSDPQARQVVISRPITQEDLNSELELFTSTYLIQAALTGLTPPAPHHGFMTRLAGAAGLALDLPELSYNTIHDAPSLTARQQWALRLERHLHPFVIKMSNVIEVNFAAHDQRWTQTFLSRLLDQYFEFHAQLSSDPEAAKFFDQHAQPLLIKLNASENALRQYEVAHQITDITAQKQALVTRTSDLQLQHNRVSAQLAANHEQVAAFSTQLQQIPEQISKETRSVQNAALEQLKPQVMQMKAKRAELLSRYQPTSRRIQEIDAKLAAAESVLNAEKHLEVEEKSSGINPVWISLDTGLEQAKVAEAGDAATLAALAKEWTDIGHQLSQLTDDGLAVTRLQRQVDTDREAYLSYVRKGEEARTAQQLNSSKILNVSLAQAPSMPLRPSSPKVLFNLLVAVLLGGILAIGAAYWEEYQDDLIYSPVTIAEVSGLQTVAIISDEA